MHLNLPFRESDENLTQKGKPFSCSKKLSCLNWELEHSIPWAMNESGCFSNAFEKH